jgi:hypothetical protein
METINIENILSNSPLEILSEKYNLKLMDKIKDEFNDEQQKLFLMSFYVYAKYDKKNDFVINLDDIWKYLGFSQKVNAKMLLEKNFIKNIDFKICENNAIIKQGRGGHNKEIILMNINTFKRLCIKADTKEANNIHEYYIKLEEIIQELITEEHKEFKNKIIQHIDENTQLKKDNQKLIVDKSLEKHNLLLKEYGSSTPLVYLVRIKTFEDGTFGLKIGESRSGILERGSDHKTKYEECVFMDCFRVLRSKDFESFLHSHPDIKPNMIKNLKGHEGEKELFLVGKDLPYNKIISIINSNINNFNTYNEEVEKLKLENENLKLMLELNKNPSNNNLIQLTNINEIIQTNKKLLDEIAELKKSNKEILEKINNIQIKNTITTNFGDINKNIGNRIQKINPDTGLLIKYYESISDVISEDSTIKRASISKASKENTVYKGFRWMEISRELDPKTITNYKPTKETKIQNVGYIAKLNSEKTEILNVYLDRKVASLSNGFQSHSALDNPVKKFSLTNGFYYCLYDSCSEELKKKFVEKNKGVPILYKNGVGQYDLNNKLIKEFVCKFDCARALGLGDRSLNKALDKNIPYNNNYFKKLPEKTKCFE